ncbi:DUF3626 domain-containing protein [Nocardioides albus]|uniref:DUF3626 domain-containing protein n=1 Tax=Nocardioides albus TaxID=1841 RepID=A0A7W5F6K6_9ACTN|nr:DUF3626 domain-containing protein [Nocardioides albus]MBB3087235.1 hypothetical protein [Nocardioides albus]GGU07603.1 hypothetical protein GCM10007979_01560 [Nocardioides albus]
MSITLQFHPDWPYAGGLVIESMARDGAYRSQFETGTSNGGLTAHPGGDRWRWESRLFGSCYDHAPAADRPVYGAWNRRDDPYGGAIRFGSAHLRLRPEVLERCTFCFPDSVLEPTDFGGPEMLPQLSAMADASGFDDLDECVEAHVHGGVVIERDAEAVVLDPSFRGTKVEAAARELGCAVEWHPGFRVSSAGLDPGYRGQEHVDLAQSLGDVLTPDLLGDAARSGDYDPQSVKRVWHYLARFGRSTAAA